MSGISRTTRECSANQFEPRLRRAFQDYFASRKLGELSAAGLVCCETRTERIDRSAFSALLEGNPDTIDYLGMILMGENLLWARVGDKSGTIVAGAKLKQIGVRAYTSKLSKESGMELGGLIGDREQSMRGKLAMGLEPAAKKFIEAVIQAVDEAKPPRKKREIPWLKWFSR